MTEPGIASDTMPTRHRERLGGFKASRGFLLYRDLNAGWCTACELVLGVTCPNCKLVGPKHHQNVALGDDVFRPTERPLQVEKHDGVPWTRVYCLRCGYHFKVIVKTILTERLAYDG